MPQRQKRKRSSDLEDRPGKLPPCEGPKLDIFPHYKSRIVWLDRLDNTDDQIQDDTVKQAYVFKVEIKSVFYALKIFRCFDPYQDYHYWNEIVEHSQEVEWHTSPFYAECRAYGRINEERERGNLKAEPAVPCLGYIILNDADRKELRKRGIETEGSIMCDSDDESSSASENRTFPLDSRGIVKKFTSQESGLKERNVGGMRKDLQQLNKLHIYNRDVRKRNYRDAKLVDFGSSWTEPHCYMVQDNSFEADETRAADLFMFDSMIEKEGIISRWRTKPNQKYKKKLRSHSGSLEDP